MARQAERTKKISHRRGAEDAEIRFFFSFAFDRPRRSGMQAKANEKQSAFGRMNNGK
jgi:hypothetical protein